MKRFEDKVDKSGDCWVWTAATRVGYGAFWYEGRQLGAHRIAWMLKHGEMPPDDMLICHHCDNPACVNPDHLFIGTFADNNRDAWEKDRGKNQWDGKVTKEVQRLHADGVSAIEIINKTGYSRTHVYRVIREGQVE